MAIQTFATVTDLEEGWRPLSQSEKALAGTLLERATAMLMDYGVTADGASEARLVTLRAVTCDMVKRALLSKDVYMGATQVTQSAGGYSESMIMSNPGGDLYVSKQERKLLGIGAGRLRSVRAAIHTPGGEIVDNW